MDGCVDSVLKDGALEDATVLGVAGALRQRTTVVNHDLSKTTIENQNLLSDDNKTEIPLKPLKTLLSKETANQPLKADCQEFECVLFMDWPLVRC